MTATRRIAAAVLLAVGVSAAQAQKWELISSPPGYTFEVDRASIRASEGRMQLWAQITYAAPKVDPQGRSFRRLVALYSIDCDTDKVGLRQIQAYASADNNHLVSINRQDDPALYDVAPGTLSTDVAKIACRRN